MKVLHLSESDFNGGAAIAAMRIVRAQQSLAELDSKLLVQAKRSNENFVFSANINIMHRIVSGYRKFFDELSIRGLSIKSRGRFTFPFWGEDISRNFHIKNAEIINLHWINGGFLSLRSLKKLMELNKPIIWTLHDMWAFTGGCHHAADCKRYKFNCSDCPSLRINGQNDISNFIFNKKKSLFSDTNISTVACSNWISSKVISSKLLGAKKIFTIPNPIDTYNFKPIDKISARKKLNLPEEKSLILIGAMNIHNVWKGFNYLIEALNLMHQLSPDLVNKIELVVFGKTNKNTLSEIPFKVQQLGKLKTAEEIVSAYNSADVYVAPSLQDNLPNTVMEAMACGVPVVAFNVGGIPDMIDHQQNGVLAKPMSSKELAEGIELILFNEELHKKFSIAAREKVLNNFRQDLVAKKYLEVYKSALEG